LKKLFDWYKNITAWGTPSSKGSGKVTMKHKLLTVVASFGIMLCLGGVYAWSIFAPELMNDYGFTALQTQMIFGVLIAVFPVTMIFSGKIEHQTTPRQQAVISAAFFGTGYVLAGISKGNFIVFLTGAGLLAGIGTGFGYLTAITTPVKCFPKKQGLVTGIAASGFGLAAVLLSVIGERMIMLEYNVLQIFTIIGIIYGSFILFLSLFMTAPDTSTAKQQVSIRDFILESRFLKLFTGIFCGSFAGLLIIGSLKSIGAEHGISNTFLVAAISIFSAANFTGRISWGISSDYIKARINVALAFTLMAVAILLTGFTTPSPVTFLLLSAVIGFCFGANFVLFAKETANIYGLHNLGIIYSYVFLGYALAGLLGPLTGGLIYDIFSSYRPAAGTAGLISLTGAIIFLWKKPSERIE
jgi:MFS transporter, OFA family, oxalate/formate antiporter